MNEIKPITDKIVQDVVDRIAFLKHRIENWASPISEKDYHDKFESRLTGAKSVDALRKLYEELEVREKELSDVKNYIYYEERRT